MADSLRGESEWTDAQVELCVWVCVCVCVKISAKAEGQLKDSVCVSVHLNDGRCEATLLRGCVLTL